MRRDMRGIGATAGLAITAALAGAALLCPEAALAQAPRPPAAHVDAMESLAGWIGTWEGSGWFATGPGERVEFTVVESVRPKLQGSVLLVEGRGTVPHGEGEALVVHEALALLSYDEVSGRYGWRSHDLRGAMIDAELDVTDEGLRWGFRSAEGAQLRFTIRLAEDRWDEVGEISFDEGGSWHRMLEMTLRKTDPS